MRHVSCSMQHADTCYMCIWFYLTCRTSTGDEQVLNKLHKVQERNQQVGCTWLSTGITSLYDLTAYSSALSYWSWTAEFETIQGSFWDSKQCPSSSSKCWYVHTCTLCTQCIFTCTRMYVHTSAINLLFNFGMFSISGTTEFYATWTREGTHITVKDSPEGKGGGHSKTQPT